MSLKLSIFENFYDLDEYMHDLTTRDLAGAVSASMNSAGRRARTQGGKQLKKRIALKSEAIRKRIWAARVRHNVISKMHFDLVFSGTPIGMINFIVGNKSKIDQKGKKIKNRRKLKARIKPGKTIKLRGAFIQDITSKQVFRHIGKGRRARKISTKSLAKIIVEQKVEKWFEDIFTKRFEREFKRQIYWRWSKTDNRYSKSPMRLPK